MLEIGVIIAVALFFYAAWEYWDRHREKSAALVLEDTSAMGEIVPPSLYPLVDPSRCIGSGACVRACPEKNVIGMVGGKVQLIGPLACVGHGACAASCPVGAISLVFGTEKRGVELPKVSAQYETSQPGVFVVGELGGMGLIRNAVRQGAQAAKYIASTPRRGRGAALDAIVVGAGPAGLSATLGLMQAGLRVQMLEREAYGGTITHYPRAKIVMTGPLDFPIFGKVNRRKMSKEQLIKLWEDIKQATQVPLVTGELVEHLQVTPDGMWQVHSNRGVKQAANVVLALGRRGSPQKLGVPGEELQKVSYRLLEPKEFAGQHVLVVGGGNSAVENALALADEGNCASVTISYRRHSFGRCRAENKMKIEEAITQGRVMPMMPSQVKHILDKHVVIEDDSGQLRKFRNDSVIIQIGGTAPSRLLSGFGIDLVTKYAER